MYTARKKIQKDKGLEPSEFEDSVAQAFFDLENGNQELKSDLKDLYINGAIQLDVAGSRKAVVIHVPYRLRKAFRKIHVRIVRELEKKFSGKDVVIVATRRIVRPPKKGSAVQRPRTRTLTAVHDGILEDVVFPAEIVGKRVRSSWTQRRGTTQNTSWTPTLRSTAGCVGKMWSLSTLWPKMHKYDARISPFYFVESGCFFGVSTRLLRMYFKNHSFDAKVVA
uniref:40S ribosomal protein S7 n=1 Tax=Zea mays TaxID=4577 RepID=A0A804R813_MAIZE